MVVESAVHSHNLSVSHIDIEDPSQSSRSNATVVSQVERVVSDLARIPLDVQLTEQFYFLCANARETHGLQNWSVAQWHTSMQEHSASARVLICGLFGREPIDTAFDNDDEARAVRNKLGEPLKLSQWQSVITFQNEVLNDEQPRESDAVSRRAHSPSFRLT